VKGPHFAAFHPLFESFAVDLAAHNDAMAERAVTLGAMVHGTARQVASASTLPEYQTETIRDLDHVRHLAERFDAYLARVREARAVAERHHDQDTVDRLTNIVVEFENHAWFLRASLAA
jgi:starvation-inducible DNA-binding protein